MSAPTPADAKRRALVVLPDGRIGRLTYWPVRLDERRPRSTEDTRRNRRPAHAKVWVAGKHLHVRPELVELAE